MRNESAPATSGGGKPIGREQVMAAVLDHAADLFAERGPTASSTRDIAARAGINQALVFRHFGSKDQLVGAVLDHLAARTAASRHHDPAAAEADARRQSRVLAHALLDGYPVGRLQQQFPGFAELLETTRAHIEDDADARLAAANAVAFRVGWQMFGPFLRSAAGLDVVAEDHIQRSIDATYALLLRNTAT